MIGVEIDFVVSDSLKALALYEDVFEVERIEATAFPKGQNEAVFSIYGARFHMLDENPEFQLLAPKPGDAKSLWFNVTVPDIHQTHAKAIAAGCAELQAITEMPGVGASNSLFQDPFGYLWMLHQMHREVSFEERAAMFEEQNKKYE